ncbi:MAG TPA: type II toxin-antitoxin system HicB family antitoxin [Mucilaginibacter sp.]|jgi:predicted RNase H-like HicB family nuclease|nr:type II toxin-antitoxin system HicB family antitoxin [Mucilaginibacter sp.]
MQFIVTIEQGENGWLVGQVNELPAAISQGKTLEDLKVNLIDAVQLITETKEKVYICI